MENLDDLKKYFNSKEYATRLIGAQEDENLPASDAPSANDRVATIIDLLTNPANKDVKEETLLTLKKEKAGHLLIDGVKKSLSSDKAALMVAACWESEINFSDQLPFFTLLACSDNYLVSLEAITVIENMEGPFNEQEVGAAIKMVRKTQETITTERVVLLNDLAAHLETL